MNYLDITIIIICCIWFNIFYNKRHIYILYFGFYYNIIITNISKNIIFKYIEVFISYSILIQL